MGRQSFDTAIDTAKAGLRVDESGKTFSKVRGLGPGIAANALEGQGVNVKQLVAGKGQGILDLLKKSLWRIEMHNLR